MIFFIFLDLNCFFVFGYNLYVFVSCGFGVCKLICLDCCVFVFIFMDFWWVVGFVDEFVEYVCCLVVLGLSIFIVVFWILVKVIEFFCVIFRD